MSALETRLILAPSRRAIVGAMAALFCVTTTAFAQNSSVKLVTLDLAVPDSPAFALLGLSPESVARPGTPRDLATTLLNGVDRRGNLQTGLAVDLVPLFLFAGNTLTYTDYKNSRWNQILGHTQISLATAKGAGDADKSLRVATGVRSTLWDAGDPRLDKTLGDCLDAIPIPVPTGPILTEAAREAFVTEATSARKPLVEACFKAFKSRRWNASSLAVGVSPSWQSTTGESDDFEYAGAAAWASLAIGLSKTVAASAGIPQTSRHFGQVIVQGRYRDKELVPNKNAKGTFFEQDSSGLGARLLLGAADRAAVVETEVAHQFPKDGDRKTSFKLSGGAQLKLASDLWISVAVGATSGGTANEQHGGFVLSSFKWAFSRESTIRI